MAFPVVDRFYRRYFNATMTDISTASSVFITMPCRGKVIRAYANIANAITGSDSALTAKINGTAITGMTGTAAVSGSGNGTAFTMSDATAANNFVDGDTVELITDGASSTTAVANWTLVVHTY
jgi:hypothetical protein